MAAIRCPHCNLPLTSSEISTGRCPVCNKKTGSLLREAKTADAPARPVANISRKDNEPKKAGFWFIFGCLMPFGIVGAIVEGALREFRSGGSYTIGITSGIMLGMGFLQSMGYLGKKKPD